MEKIFKSIDEQIEILKNKGLKFKDEEKAKEILLRENYYYLTQDYEDVFLNLKKSKNGQEEYNKDTYFEELFEKLYEDKELAKQKANAMYEIYSPENEKKYGVVGIKIKLVDNWFRYTYNKHEIKRL